MGWLCDPQKCDCKENESIIHIVLLLDEAINDLGDDVQYQHCHGDGWVCQALGCPVALISAQLRIEPPKVVTSLLPRLAECDTECGKSTDPERIESKHYCANVCKPVDTHSCDSSHILNLLTPSKHGELMEEEEPE